MEREPEGREPVGWNAVGPHHPTRAIESRAAAARRTLDRLLLVAIAASLVAALFEQRARKASSPVPIASFPIDLANDPAERLRLLPGLGPTRLAALLHDRETRGAPRQWADLERVHGIGGKTLEAWRASGGILDAPGSGRGAGTGTGTGAGAATGTDAARSTEAGAGSGGGSATGADAAPAAGPDSAAASPTGGAGPRYHQPP